MSRESDPRMLYIKALLDYFFVHRDKLKAKSILHQLMLDRQERKEMIEDCQKYVAKFDSKAEQGKKRKARAAK